MDNNIISSSEPSVGQTEYLQYLRVMRTVQKPSFMRVELELPVIDVTAVEKTIDFILKRHESLRTVFPVVNNEIRQAVLPVADQRLQLEYIDVTGIDDEEFLNIRESHYNIAASVFADIENGPLVKMLMFRRSNNGYFFALLMHHIICDEWSRSIAREELVTVYQSFLSGDLPVIPPLAVALRDYCEQQNRWLYEHKEDMASFWKEKLQDFDTIFDMTGYQKMYGSRRNALSSEPMGRNVFGNSELAAILDKPDASSYTSLISGALFAQVKSMAADNRSTLSSCIYASFFLLVYAYTGKKKILIPALMADRYQPDYQQLIGCLLGSMYLAVAIDEQDTIDDLISELNGEIADVIVNRRFIFSHKYLQLDGNRIRNCCDMYINYFSRPVQLLDDQYNIGVHEKVGAIHYPIYILVREFNDSLIFIWKYNTHLFQPAMIEDIVMYYNEILQDMVSNQGQTIGELFDRSRMAIHNL